MIWGRESGPSAMRRHDRYRHRRRGTNVKYRYVGKRPQGQNAASNQTVPKRNPTGELNVASPEGQHRPL